MISFSNACRFDETLFTSYANFLAKVGSFKNVKEEIKSVFVIVLLYIGYNWID